MKLTWKVESLMLKIQNSSIFVLQKRKQDTMAKSSPSTKRRKVEMTTQTSQTIEDASPKCTHKTKKQQALEANPLHFKRGEFVAVRNESGAFALNPHVGLVC